MNNNYSILYLMSFLPTYLLSEIKELQRREINIRIMKLGNSPRSEMWDVITSSGREKFDIINYPVDLREVNGLKEYEDLAKKIYELVKNKIVSRIHVHFAKKEAHVGLQLAEILDVPFSVTTHANDIFVPQDINELKYLLNESDQVFTISDFNKKYLERLAKNISDRVKVTYLGIDTDSLPQRDKKEKNFFSIYSTASGLGEKKGIPYLIKACEILKSKKIKFKCTIAGSDPDGVILNQLRKKILSKGLTENINLPGIISSEMLLKEIAQSDVFVLPCIEGENGDMDGIPVSLIEAMGIGVPVISTNISGIPELIDDGENGFIVAPKDPEVLAEKLIEFYHNPSLREEFGNNGIKKIKNQFSLTAYADQLIYHWLNNKEILTQQNIYEK